MDEEAKRWSNLHEKMNQGKIDYNSNFYIADTSQEGGGDVKLVTPTQAQVEQARVQLKRKLSLPRNPFPKRRKTSKKKTQVGGKKGRKAKRGVKKSQRGGKKSQRGGKKPVKRLKKSVKAKRRKRKI